MSDFTPRSKSDFRLHVNDFLSFFLSFLLPTSHGASTGALRVIAAIEFRNQDGVLRLRQEEADGDVGIPNFMQHEDINSFSAGIHR